MNECAENLAFLLAGSFNTLPESYIKLRSYLSVHLSNVAAKHGLKLPRYFTNKNITCPFCYTPWKFNTNSLKLMPSSGKKFKLDLTSDKKNEEEINCSKNISEETFHTRNKLVLKCYVCTEKSSFSLMKPQTKYVNQIEEDKSSSKKKKKKKNKYANLNIEACKAAKIKKVLNKNNNNKNRIKNNKKEKNKLCSVASIQNKTENQSQKILNKSVSEVKPSIMSCTKFNSSQTIEKNESNSNKNKKVLVNPYYKKMKNEKPDVKNKRKQLALIKRALKEEKTPPKSSIRDFLNVISN